MRIVYTYRGPRDAGREGEVASDLAGRFGAAEQCDCMEADDGTVSVTLAVRAPDAPGEDVAAGLRDRPWIIDAAAESFGEGA